MICPWCKYTPRKNDDPKFTVIKTNKGIKIDVRGHGCPKCMKSFISHQTAQEEHFYQREKDGYFRISEATV